MKWGYRCHHCGRFGISICFNLLLQQFSKRISDYEPRFTEATDAAHKLCKDSAFSAEQNKAFRKDVEDCEDKWDEMVDKAKDRMDK